MNLATGTGLAARLKTETQGLHTLAERSGIMADLVRGRISLDRYCALLRNLQALYAALEAGLDQHPTDAQQLLLWRCYFPTQILRVAVFVVTARRSERVK